MTNERKLRGNTPDLARNSSQGADRRLLKIVVASTSGHTQYIVDVLIQSLEQLAPGWQIVAATAEQTQPEHLRSGGVLVLASSTGGAE